MKAADSDSAESVNRCLERERLRFECYSLRTAGSVSEAAHGQILATPYHQHQLVDVD